MREQEPIDFVYDKKKYSVTIVADIDPRENEYNFKIKDINAIDANNEVKVLSWEKNKDKALWKAARGAAEWHCERELEMLTGMSP